MKPQNGANLKRSKMACLILMPRLSEQMQTKVQNCYRTNFIRAKVEWNRFGDKANFGGICPNISESTIISENCLPVGRSYQGTHLHKIVYLQSKDGVIKGFKEIGKITGGFDLPCP